MSRQLVQKSILVLLASLACVALAGCATGPDFNTYTSTLSRPKEGESRIWFYRPSKVIGYAVQPLVFINDTPLGKAQPGCFFYTDRPPGTYQLRCTTEWADKAQLTVVENRVEYVRLTLLPGVFIGHILPTVVPEDEALKEIQSCHLITADGMNANWKPSEKSDGTNLEPNTAPVVAPTAPSGGLFAKAVASNAPSPAPTSTATKPTAPAPTASSSPVSTPSKPAVPASAVTASDLIGTWQNDDDTNECLVIHPDFSATWRIVRIESTGHIHLVADNHIRFDYHDRAVNKDNSLDWKIIDSQTISINRHAIEVTFHRQ